ncbi:hypothetical protein DFH08DRAFT_828272 [Mycena albidolilacea]|uniref:Uncharacterized protein n=1 Tax=Mycena albidolilacea TaxID=1033008 RepID=A0AAD6YWL3_9AGAR|nr:hypothetical protein DFH08DRAFT_828272 [Mycena albidolilacea]
MARVKRLIDTIKYTGPAAVAGDCTKCIVENPEEIDAVIAKIMTAKAEASQVRAILVKVPLPHVPPQVVALIPIDGKDDAPKILELNLQLLQMAAELNLKVVTFAADGAASEPAAQNMFEKLKTNFPPLIYLYPLYGIHLRTPVFETGPAVAGSDVPHGSETGSNQHQTGTHTASMGKGKVVNNDLARLRRIGLLEERYNRRGQTG